MNEHNYFLNDIAIYLIMKFLRKIIRSKKDLYLFQKYHFDLPQFEIDLCKAIDSFLAELECTQHYSWTARFTCRGRTTAYRNTKKHAL